MRRYSRDFRARQPTLGIPFTPKQLFNTGAQGVWYDPGDFSTLFQDSLGATPVTVVGQQVGLMLDKSRGLVLGSELVTNGDFSNGTVGWSDASTPPATFIVTGGSSVLTSDGTNRARMRQTISTVAGKTYLISANASATLDISASGTTAAGIDILAVSVPGSFSRIFVATTSTTYFQFSRLVTGAVTVDNISVREIPGNHASQATATSRPILQQDSSGRYFLACDGIDDSMVTSAINLTSTDKVTVCAGLRKLSDAARGMFLEFGNANLQAFRIEAPLTAGQTQYVFASSGSSGASVSPTGYAAPITSVLTGVGNTSGDACTLRVNYTQVANSTADQGTGNYGNYVLNLFRRGGATLPFNGRFYGLTIVGSLLSDTDLRRLEQYTNRKTGAV